MTAKVPAGGSLDPSMYIEPPLLDTVGMLSLGRALLYLAPTPPPPELVSSLARLKQAWEDLNAAGRAPREQGLKEHPGKQPADVALDNAWTALYERLRAYMLVIDSEMPQVRRAQDLLRLLFPDALAFLKLPYEQEWSESGSRLRLIEKLKLEAEVNALAGAEFLTHVRRTHETYGKMLGMSGESSGPVATENPNVREQRAALGRCISHYAIRVLHTADEDPGSARRLLAPLVEYHRMAAQRQSAGRPSGDSKPSTSGERWIPTNRTGDSGTFRQSSESGTFRAANESGTFRIPSDPGPLRPLPDVGSNPHRHDSGVFRVTKKPTP